jgi:hypothetical protein
MEWPFLLLFLGIIHTTSMFHSHLQTHSYLLSSLKKYSMAWVREWTIPRDCCLSMKLVPTFADRGCHVVSMTVPYGHNLSFLDRSHYFFFQVVPQLYSWGWVDPVQTHYFSENPVVPELNPDLWIYSQELWPLKTEFFAPPNVVNFTLTI